MHALSGLRWIFREYPVIYSRWNVLIKLVMDMDNPINEVII